jgi:homoserine kinase type II
LLPSKILQGFTTVGSYTKIDQSQAQSIIDLYGLGEVESIRALSLGISNSNYCVKLTHQQYLLKISNDKNIQELCEEQLILGYLRDNGYRYSLSPIPTLKSEPVYKLGDFYGVLYPFVVGIPPGPSDQTCMEIGKALALLHTLPKREPYDQLRRHEKVGFGPSEVKNYLHEEGCPDDFKEIYHQVFPDDLERFVEAELPEGIIHGDLYYDNTLFEHTSLSVVLDFEQAGRGELLLDMGISISGTCLEKGRLSKPLIESYLSGYESVRKLTAIEKGLFHQSIILGFYSIALWRIKRFKERDLNPMLKDSYQELIMKALTYQSTIAKEDIF